ncbi:uncharacterized protein LOC110985731 isoform X2 [Acanthaster planci]|uniref:Uncharacterized protein LOC110985731 isoform X2 n=1 Tax=Acanthaster planci TaxID=133434 RepID=A0A8B7ZCE7_ACAPL|nr:uncharacterized protein LOC110985731 isoform X2 [Acanthaster planci]
MKLHVAMDIGENCPACQWHTDGETSTGDQLRRYVMEASRGSPVFQRLEADLKECRKCMGAYHKAREQLIQEEGHFDLKLFQLEERRLTETFRRDTEEQDILVPITEVLWHPYLLFHPELEAVFCRRLLKLDKDVGLEGFLTECLPTMYLLLIHRNEEVRELAWRCLQNPDYRITCDNYEDTNMGQAFRWVMLSAEAIEPLTPSPQKTLAIFHSPSQVKELPPHFLCTKLHAYWQGVARLLSIFSVEALKHCFTNSPDFKKLIPTMIDHFSTKTDDKTSGCQSSFWPLLQCLAFLMDKVGRVVWQDVPEATVKGIFDTAKNTIISAIENMIKSGTEQVPTAPGMSVGPSEPFLWMTLYVNSLMDFGISVSDSVPAKVTNFLCIQLEDLLRLGCHGDSLKRSRIDSLIAKFMQALVNVLQSLLKRSLLGDLVREVKASMWLRICLAFLQKYPPVRGQQDLSFAITVSNSIRQFLLDVFKLAQKNKLSVGQSVKYIKMLGLPLLLTSSARCNIQEPPISLQENLCEMTQGKGFTDCVKFVEETLKQHSSLSSIGIYQSLSVRESDTACVPGPSTRSPVSCFRKNSHKLKLRGPLSFTSNTMQDKNVLERNDFSDNEASTSPKHASRPHEEAVHPLPTSPKWVLPVPTKSVIKSEPGHPQLSSGSAPSMHQPGSTAKPNRSSQKSSDVVISISDDSSDEAFCQSPTAGQEFCDDALMQDSEEIYEILSHTSQSEDSQNEPADNFSLDVPNARKEQWQPSVKIELIPELTDISEDGRQFIVTSMDPVIIKNATPQKTGIKRERVSSDDSESSLSNSDIRRDAHLKAKKNCRRRLTELESSSDDDTGRPPSSSPSTSQSWLWPSSPSGSSLSRPFKSSPKYPRNRLSRSRRLNTSMCSIVKNERHTDAYVPEREEYQPLVKKELLSDDGDIASAVGTSKAAQYQVEIKEEGVKKDGKGKLLSHEKSTKSRNRGLFSDGQALDYLNGALSAIANDNDSVSQEPVMSNSDDSCDSEAVISFGKDWGSSVKMDQVAKPDGDEEEMKPCAEENTNNLLLLGDHHQDSKSPVSPVFDTSDSAGQEDVKFRTDDPHKPASSAVVSKASHQVSRDEEHVEEGRLMQHGPEEISSESGMRPFSPISDDSSSENSQQSESLLTQQIPIPEQVQPFQSEDSLGSSKELKQRIDKLVSEMCSYDSSEDSDSSVPDVALISHVISSDESTCMAPEKVPSDELKDCKLAVQVVLASASLDNSYSSQGFSYIEDRLDSDEIIDLENYNCSELYDEDRLSQLIEISSDEGDYLDQTAGELNIDLDIKVKQEPEGDHYQPNRSSPSIVSRPVHSSGLSEDPDFISALQDHEDTTWFEDEIEEEDYLQDQQEGYREVQEVAEEVEMEQRQAKQRRLVLEEEEAFIAGDLPDIKSHSSSPLENAAAERAIQDHNNHGWFDDDSSPAKESTEGLDSEEKSTDNVLKKALDDITALEAATEEGLQTESQQKEKEEKSLSHSRIRWDESSESGKRPSLPKRAAASYPPKSSTDGVVEGSSVSEPTSSLSKVQGSWKPGNFHQPEFTPANAEPLKRFRGSSNEPELVDTYVLDSSQPRRRPRAARDEERPSTSVQSWASRFSSRTGSLFQTMKEGPPSAQKGNQDKDVTPSKRVRHSSGPPTTWKTAQSLDTTLKVTTPPSSYVESLPHYAQPVYAHATVPAVSLSQTVSTSTQSCSNTASMAGQAAPMSNSANGVNLSNNAASRDANIHGQQMISELESPLPQKVPSISQPRFQFFTSDPQMAETAASLPALVNSSVCRNSTAVSSTAQTETSLPSNDATKTSAVASQAKASKKGEPSGLNREISTVPALSVQQQAAVQLPKAARFSMEDLFCWVIGWNSQWLDIYGPQSEGQSPSSVPQAILADCPYKQLLDVPSSFDFHEDYFKVFVPLLLHEIWAQLQSKVEVGSASIEAAFVECRHKEQRQTGLLLSCTFKVQGAKATCPVSPQDVIKVSPSEEDPTCSWCPLLAVVTDVTRVVLNTTGARNLNHNASVNVQGLPRTEEKLFEVSVLILAKSEEIYRALSATTGHKVRLKVLHSLVSAIHQFQGLISLHKCGIIASDILRFRRMEVFSSASSSAPSNMKPDKCLNPCQLQAVSRASAAVAMFDTLPRICLVNGPPATGRTKTVIQIVKQVLKNQAAKQHQQCLPGKRNSRSQAKPPPVLLCAPSHTLVNVLLRQLMREIPTMFPYETQPSDRGATKRYHVVRVHGPSAVIHDSVKKFSLDSQVEAQRKQDVHRIDLNLERSTKKRESLHRQITELEKNCELHNHNSNKEELIRVQQRKKQLIKDLTINKLKLEDQKRQRAELEGRPNAIYERAILDRADVICCTVNFTGSQLLQDTGSKDGARQKMKFSCVIVDEANQCMELDSIIPLQNCSMKVVLVGDPKLTRATVASKEANQHGLHRSLFERLCGWFPSGETHPSPICRLKNQHRMHPEIAAFPSKHFYGGGLLIDKNMAKRRQSFFLHPYLIFNVIQSKEVKTSQRSYANEAEQIMVLKLYHRICREKMKDKVIFSEPTSMGIIVLSKDQASYISLCQKKAEKELAASSPKNFLFPSVEISTPDQFQGREKDVIIISCVRTQGSSDHSGSSCSFSSNFFSDGRKINFLLTRARYSLFIVGNLSFLQSQKEWWAVVADADKRKCVIHVPRKLYEKAARCCVRRPSSAPPGSAQCDRPTQGLTTQTCKSLGSPKHTVEGSVTVPSNRIGDSKRDHVQSPVVEKPFASSSQGSATVDKTTARTMDPPASQASLMQGRVQDPILNEKESEKPAVKSCLSTPKVKKITNRVTFQQSEALASHTLLPRPMQSSSGAQSQGGQQNPYKMASRSPERSQTAKRSPKLPQYRHILKKRLMPWWSPQRSPQSSPPATKLTPPYKSRPASRGEALKSALGSLLTSLRAQTGLVTDPQQGSGSSSHFQDSLAPVTADSRASVGTARPSREEGITTPRKTGITRERLRHQEECSAQQPTTSLGDDSSNQRLSTQNEDDQLRITVENVKRNQGKEKRTMALAGLQPDPRLARRRRSTNSGAEPPETQSGNSNRCDYPQRDRCLPGIDSE